MNILKNKRLELGLTQLQMSEKLGVSLQTVKNMEVGRKFPLFKNIKIVADAYGLTNEEIVQWLSEIE